MQICWVQNITRYRRSYFGAIRKIDWRFKRLTESYWKGTLLLFLFILFLVLESENNIGRVMVDFLSAQLKFLSNSFAEYSLSTNW